MSEQLDKLSGRAVKDLTTIYARLEPKMNAEGIQLRQHIVSSLLTICEAYAPGVATLASEEYLQARQAQGSTGRFTPTLRQGVVPGQVEASVKWAFTPFFYAQDPSQTATLLKEVCNRLVRLPGLHTLEANLKSDRSAPDIEDLLTEYRTYPQ